MRYTVDEMTNPRSNVTIGDTALVLGVVLLAVKKGPALQTPTPSRAQTSARATPAAELFVFNSRSNNVNKF
jgi:hypothetical protein